MKILIIEDEKKLVELMEKRLKEEKYHVDYSLDGEEGYYKASTNVYDLIILDVMLPYKDGFTILNDLRNEKINSKIIMLTARSELEDKLKGLTNGADDYITKPFHLEELIARVNNTLKHSINNTFLEYHDIKLDLNKKTITNINTQEEVEVLCKEFLLLECMLRNKGQVVSKEFIYDYVWGIDNDSISNNLEAYLSFIRKKLKAIDSKVNIKSVRNLGYKLEVINE